MIRLAALGLCVSALSLLLRGSDAAFALLLAAAAVLVGCALLLPTLFDLAELISHALALTALPETLFVPLFKVVGIALVTRFAGALCADAGQSALAALLQTAGTVCALVCTLPLLEALLNLVEGYL